MMKNLIDERNRVQSPQKLVKNSEPGYGANSVSEANATVSKKNRIYVISEYHADDEGKFMPELPDFGPCHIWDDCPCKLVIHHFRDRKTGPPFPLSVVRCETHDKAFTIYPPGHYPYGRQLLAPVAPDGGLIMEKSGVERFEGTLFDAAMDAARGHVWPNVSMEGSLTPRLGAQNRHLSRIALMLGIQPGLHERLREDSARVLELSGQLLLDSAALIKERPDARSQGKAICCILNVIENSTSLFERLAEAGSNVCLWPPPKRWNPRLRNFQSSPHLSNIT
ncbi:MAG: hypothetical protein GY847_09715 [Proteobacteria bacterium]|nr:hypothetical protein [Pseudomonadota bacterium]